MKKMIVFICMVLLLASMNARGDCPVADANGDCKVNLEDFAILAALWLNPSCNENNNWCDKTDIDKSGDVGMNDLAIITENWFIGINGPDGIIFANIPAGTFQMGDNFNEGYSDELPVHTVTLSSFQMSKHEITNGQYCQYLNAALAANEITVYNNRVYAKSDTIHSNVYLDTMVADSDSHIDYHPASEIFYVPSKNGRSMHHDPVVLVSWYGADAFCDFYGYKLPTEAQWEYAARGGYSGRRFPWGDTINHSYANYRANGSAYSYDTSPYTYYTYHPSWNDGVYPYTAPVGSFPANGYGLYDMSGNVWEWCADWWYGSYPSSSQSNPTGPSNGSFCVLRGGCWYYGAGLCRVASRVSFTPYYAGLGIGFRVCR
ncbi:MAG: SUMF1/EgtB/PvdO family nonheme iron enzyme [Phycisphaerae bacterium]|nr:SUMF1/EgtB/PvdO family nonheme iron enzyme [Phycisphaerae bacterium]